LILEYLVNDEILEYLVNDDEILITLYLLFFIILQKSVYLFEIIETIAFENYLNENSQKILKAN